jgi:hypothetical protein
MWFFFLVPGFSPACSGGRGVISFARIVVYVSFEAL